MVGAVDVGVTVHAPGPGDEFGVIDAFHGCMTKIAFSGADLGIVGANHRVERRPMAGYAPTGKCGLTRMLDGGPSRAIRAANDGGKTLNALMALQTQSIFGHL